MRPGAHETLPASATELHTSSQCNVNSIQSLARIPRGRPRFGIVYVVAHLLVPLAVSHSHLKHRYEERLLQVRKMCDLHPWKRIEFMPSRRRAGWDG